ncbi:MAG: hypothetical protein KJ799_14075 [Bacteroidetes bacterium]|nr:hypothetical protein [Bacteroidota bacterium]MBU1680453.1 hypothetical protein [Bacteroidota bacterium]MBU2507832.1 hypothetical protein [Bacteroidota bacterium]
MTFQSGLKYKINKNIRFIELHAENIKYLPEWHYSEGSKVWLFADEIVIEVNE